MKKKLLGIGFGVFLIALWQVLSMIINASYILPSPIKVVESLVKNFGELMTKHFMMTMQVVLIGCVIALVLGLAFAVLMSVSKAVEKAVYPILTISQTIPTMCLTPIFVLLFGYTTTTRVIVVVLMTFFSITVNVFDGFQAVRRETSELLQTYGANKVQLFFTLKVPTALPYFFTALKVSVPWAVVAAAVAEWFGSPGGLGYYSRQKMMSLDAAGLLSPLIIISAVALIFTGIIKFIERKIVTWGNEI